MEAENQNYQKLMDRIDYNNYLLGVNSNLKRKQPKTIPILNMKARDKTPAYTRIRNPLNRDNNYNPYHTSNNIIENNIKERNNFKFISSSYKNKEEYNPSNISDSSNNTLFNNVMNKNKNINNLNNSTDQNNYSVNYTMRESNYSNFSGSGFTTLTYNDLNSKYNYYKVLFHQVKGHNLALLNQIKKDKDLNGIIKSLENENNKLKRENQRLKETNNYHANSDGEEENIRNTINKNKDYKKYFDQNKNVFEKAKKEDINTVLLRENNILKDEIKKYFKYNKDKKIYKEDELNNIIIISNEINFKIIDENVNKNQKDYNENKNKKYNLNKKSNIDYLNILKNNKNEIKNFNKEELTSIVENLQDTNEEQKNELINLYNKIRN